MTSQVTLSIVSVHLPVTVFFTWKVSKLIRNAMKLILSLRDIDKPERGNILETPEACRNTKNIT